MLIDAGADVNAERHPYTTLVQVASKNGFEEIVQMLMSKLAQSETLY